MGAFKNLSIDLEVQGMTIKDMENNMNNNLNTYIEISKLSVRMETKDKLIVSLVDGTAIWLNKNNCFNNEFILTFRASFFTNDKAGQPTLINKWKLNTLTGAYDDTGLKVSLQDLNTLTGVK